MSSFPYHWLIVAVATIGLMVSYGPIVGYTFGIFLKSLVLEFGWQRGQVSSILTVLGIAHVIYLPIAGRLVDRFGPRRVLIPAMIGFGLSVAVLGVLPGRLFYWYIWVAVLAMFSSTCGPLPYASMLTAWFDKQRGLALGIAIAGIGMGTMIFPVLTQAIIESSGWRHAYFYLGGVVLLVGLPLVAAIARNTPQEMGYRRDGLLMTDTFSSNHTEYDHSYPSSSVSAGRAIKTSTFWIFATAFFLVATAIIGVALHLVPLMTDRGVTPQVAALLLGLLGISSTLGRVLVGWLMDRFFAPNVAIVFFLGPALACLMLAMGASGPLAFLSAALMGFGVGAEVDVIAYVTGRYFGSKHFTEIYGLLFAAFSVGIAVGPVVMGYGYDLSQNYTFPLIFNFVLVLIACTALRLVGPYPNLGTEKLTDFDA